MYEVLKRVINSYSPSVLLSRADSPSSVAVTEIPEQLEGQDSVFPNTTVTSTSSFQFWSPAGGTSLIYPLFSEENSGIKAN